MRWCRDSLLWPGSALSPFPPLPKSLASTEGDLRSHINRSLSDFCPSLNCLHHFCSAHCMLMLTPISSLFWCRFQATSHPSYDTIKPTVTSSMMKLSEGSTCGEDCFRLIDDTADVFMVKTSACLSLLFPDGDYRKQYTGRTLSMSKPSPASLSWLQIFHHVNLLLSAGSRVAKYMALYVPWLWLKRLWFRFLYIAAKYYPMTKF
jgi:hypothetical protein